MNSVRSRSHFGQPKQKVFKPNVIQTNKLFRIGESMIDWIVFYDISNNRRRTRVAKRLVKEGLRIQKSVFFLTATRRETERIVDLISEEIDQETDLVCAWPLANGWQEQQFSAPDEAILLTERFVIA